MEASNTWGGINNALDGMGLLQLIQNCMVQHQTCQKPIHSLLDTEAQVYGFKQKTLPNNKYYEKFKGLVTNANQLGSSIRAHPKQVTKILQDIAVDPDMPTTREHEHAKKELTKDQFLVVMFLINCNHNWYGNLVRDIENEYTHRMDTYPTSLSAAYDYIVNYHPENRSSQHDPDKGGLSYYTKEADSTGHGRGRGGCGSGQGSRHGHGSHGGCGNSSNDAGGSTNFTGNSTTTQ